MKVSVVWVALGLILIVILGFSLRAYNIYEGWQNEEGFTDGSTPLDIKINTCPVKLVQYIDDQGRTSCCSGPIVDGKCSGQAICSLSESAAGLPTCSTYYASVLDEKGGQRCPPNMPNYFESESGEAGCTEGPRTQKGTAPLNASQPMCRFYTTQEEEESKADSCTNQKFLATQKCFTRMIEGTNKTLTNSGDAPALVACSYKDINTKFTKTCYTDDSIYRYYKYAVSKGIAASNWRDTWDEVNKTNFCSKAQQVFIDKTKTIADMKNEKI